MEEAHDQDATEAEARKALKDVVKGFTKEEVHMLVDQVFADMLEEKN